MERTDEWPRVHTCLYDWCPRQSDECARCDALVKILRDNAAARQSIKPTTENPSPEE